MTKKGFKSGWQADQPNPRRNNAIDIKKIRQEGRLNGFEKRMSGIDSGPAKNASARGEESHERR